MLKHELKDGMILETRDGKRYLLVNDIMRGLVGFTRLENYDEDLTYRPNHEFDIVKVYKDRMAYSLIDMFENLILIWERKEAKITNREIEALKALKILGYEWLARDKNGKLFAYGNKPYKVRVDWVADFSGVWYATKKYKNLFNFIKWENDEPTKIDDLLKEVE